MPYLQHQGVGSQLVYARSDHTIPIPRPLFDQQIGIENACQKCHRDRDLSWQEAKVKEWYGEIKPHHKMIANLIQAQATGDQRAAPRLLLEPRAKHPMAQMAGLATYIERFMRPNMHLSDAEVVEKLKAFAKGDDLDLKSIALMALHLGYDQDSDVRAFLVGQLKGLNRREEAVRRRWGIAAGNMGSGYAASGDTSNATVCFRKSLEAQPDNFVTMSHLALTYLKSADFQNAIVWLNKAVQLKPHKATLHFQLAQTYAQLGQISQATQSLEEGLKYAPDDQAAQRLLQQLRGP
jgi:tetratricopeptide (TPR) repeat protein